jgi:hypothetical protein
VPESWTVGVKKLVGCGLTSGTGGRLVASAEITGLGSGAAAAAFAAGAGDGDDCVAAPGAGPSR